MRTALALATVCVGLLPLPLFAQAANRPGQAAPAGQVPPRIVQGRVISLRRAQGGAILQIRSNQRAVNVAAAGVQGAAAGQPFNIGPNTYFQVARGASVMPANAAMVRPGQRVMVQAQGQQALGVRILMSSQYARGRRGYSHVRRGRGYAHAYHAHPRTYVAVPHVARTGSVQRRHASTSHVAHYHPSHPHAPHATGHRR